MVFPVAELLSYCSRSFTLEPGDVVEIDGIGTLRNPVVERGR